jgi:hypothetical protein
VAGDFLAACFPALKREILEKDFEPAIVTIVKIANIINNIF